MHVFLWCYGETTVATAVFTSPVNRFFGKGAIELARLVRLPSFDGPLSMFVSECLRWLKKNTNLRYCLSYADSTVGHCGFIYQACNFIHVAVSRGSTQYREENTGKIVSGRSFDQQNQKQGWVKLKTGRKFLYVYPLGEPRRKLLERFNWSPLPYPKDVADAE